MTFFNDCKSGLNAMSSARFSTELQNSVLQVTTILHFGDSKCFKYSSNTSKKSLETEQCSALTYRRCLLFPMQNLAKSDCDQYFSETESMAHQSGTTISCRLE